VQRAAAAGIEVILNTGRPAGYGAALLAYVAGISAVVVENGGAWLDRTTAADPREVAIQFAAPPPPDLRAQLGQLADRVASATGLAFTPTADCAYRLTDLTVVRDLPAGAAGRALLAQVEAAVASASQGAGSLLASSIHLHFMLDGAQRRSKAAGALSLLARRGLADPAATLRTAAVAVGDSANDASLFAPGHFALSVGVRNIERYLPELGPCQPQHLTKASEGHGLIELIDELLAGQLPRP
jgi:hydroxymethylpyrimidine pyrophosphatase-like HAD family hydrolase